jgi:hypothetical protein
MSRQTRSRNEKARGKAPAPVHRTPVVAALACAVLLLILFVAPFSLWGNPYPDEVEQYWLMGAVAVGVIAIVCAVLPLDGIVSRARAMLLRPPTALFCACVMIAVLAASMVLSSYVFNHAASTSDELAQLWHARILLHGRWFLPPDPNPEFFALDNVIDAPRWYSQFPVGGPFFLALGSLVHAPWIVDPICAALSAGLVYLLARHVFDELLARVATLVFACSPMLLLMAGTWMNHVPVLLLSTAALLCLAHWESAESPGRTFLWAGLIGACLGAIADIRPYDAVILAVVIGVFQLWTTRRDLARLRSIVSQAVAGAIVVSPLLYANAVTTGRMFTFGYEVLWGPGHRVGFHIDPYGRAHTAARGLDYLLTYAGELNVYATAWPVPVILLIAFGLVVQRRWSRWDALLLALFGAQLAGYGAYWYRGEFLGPRFLYSVLPAVIILATRSLFSFARRFGQPARRAISGLTVACVLAAWTVPAGVNGLGLVTQARGQRSSFKIDIAGVVRAAGVHNAVVFIRERFGTRLTRRLWAIGVGRAESIGLVATRDACDLLSSITVAEDSTSMPPSRKVMLVRSTPRFRPNANAVRVLDATIHISGPEAITPACMRELRADSVQSPIPFGPALVLEPIDSAGRVAGDIVYASDLIDHDAALRARFAGRRWYMLSTGPDGRSAAKLIPLE